MLLCVVYSSLINAQVKVVYGTDGRQEVQTANRKWQSLAKSTAALIPIENLEYDSARRVYKLSAKGQKSLGESMNLCSGEKFSEQPNAAICSGFLTKNNVLITAGHCAKDSMANVCSSKKYVWVFDYKTSGGSNPMNMEFPAKNVTGCDRVLKADLDDVTDYAALKLTKKIKRSPLALRTSGAIKKGEKLVVIGVPWGIPTKVTTGGRVLHNRNGVFFSASVDTFQGNSGSAVFNERTGLVEGILVRGKADSYQDQDYYCARVNTCDENGNNCQSFMDNQKAEDITRMPFVYKKIKHLL